MTICEINMFWTEEDSQNLNRIANALETIAGKKTFVSSNEKIPITEVEDNAEEIEAEENKRTEKITQIMEENKGKHLWEETNLEEDQTEEEF